jgi:phospholipase C
MGAARGSMGDIRDPLDAERLQAIAPDAYHTRREFLQRTAVTAGLAAGLGLVLDPDTVVAEAARRQRAHQIPSARNLPIDTFVVLMMENRSFDHYLGWLPGADGRQAGLTFTDGQGQAHSTYRLRDNYQGGGFLDPDHSWQGGRTELDGGRMDGFLRAQSDVFSIGYYAEPDLPFTPHVAKVFTAFDRFFCSLLASTYPNREYMHSGQSYGMMDNSLPFSPTGELGFPDTTIFHALSQAGVSNRYFFTDIPVSALWGAPGIARSSQVQTYYEQAAGTLPALSFVDPAFNGEDQGTSGDEHPHGDVRVGQAFVADVVHAFLESPQYKRGALFIVNDEWGGFFDHVVPPRVPDLRASTEPGRLPVLRQPRAGDDRERRAGRGHRLRVPGRRADDRGSDDGVGPDVARLQREHGRRPNPRGLRVRPPRDQLGRQHAEGHRDRRVRHTPRPVRLLPLDR